MENFVQSEKVITENRREEFWIKVALTGVNLAN
jgi:hypothetical protein